MTMLQTKTYRAECACGRIELSVLENGDLRLNGATAGTCKAAWLNMTGALICELEPDPDTLRRFAVYIADIRCHKHKSCAAALAECIDAAVADMGDEQ